MTDYTNWREWKLVELMGSQVYLSDTTEYPLENLIDIFSKLLKEGEEEGLENCRLMFCSNQVPYEDYLGSPSVFVVGYRKLNENELKAIQGDDLLEALAKELKISVYEARHLKNLEDKGLVKRANK